MQPARHDIFAQDLSLISWVPSDGPALCTRSQKNTKSAATFSSALDCSLHSGPWYQNYFNFHFQQLNAKGLVILLGSEWITVLMGAHVYRCSSGKTSHKLFHDISHITKKGPNPSTIYIFYFRILSQECSQRQSWESERSRKKVLINIQIVQMRDF